MKIVSTSELKQLNAEAQQKGLNRQLPEDLIERLDSEGSHILGMGFIHEHAKGEWAQPHIRTQVFAKTKDRGPDEPVEATLDVPLDSYIDLSSS